MSLDTFAKKKVMVVDDDADVLEFIRMCLDGDYQLTLIKDGAEAAQRLSEEHHDLVIVDIYLPGMDGASLIRRIRQRGATPILAISGFLSRDQYLHEALACGAMDFIEKPFPVGKLLSAVASLLTLT